MSYSYERFEEFMKSREEFNRKMREESERFDRELARYRAERFDLDFSEQNAEPSVYFFDGQ